VSVRASIAYGLYRLGTAAVRGLPVATAHNLAAGIGRRMFDRGGKRREVALANLRIAFPDLSEQARREIGRESFAHFAQNVVDVIRSQTWSDDEIRSHVTIEGLDHAMGAVAGGRGAFGLTLHLGCFELITLAAALDGLPSAAVARPLSNPRLYRDVVRNRSRTGAVIIDRRRGARDILRALRDGRAVGVLNDQYSRRRRGVFVPFFGVRCSTSAGLATLSLRSGAPVFTVYARRDAPDHHRVRFGPVLEIPRSGDRAKDIEFATARYNEVIEEIIRAYPEQYMWAHRRYKRSPDLAEDPYPPS
jgi:KDO2-lipid IV(A) lauroyltransferase